MRERYISQDRAEQLIADIINRGGTIGEILTEIHHMEAADAMAAMEPNFGAGAERSAERDQKTERRKNNG